MIDPKLLILLVIISCQLSFITAILLRKRN